MSQNDITSELEKGEQSSAILLIDMIVHQAFLEHASDIHLDPLSETIIIKFRTNGILTEKYIFNKRLLPELIARIKILAHLRTDEHTISQDGRFTITTKDKTTCDVRVSIAPTSYGENAVLRLLKNTYIATNLKTLGFESDQCELILRQLKRKQGMILITGPTGSGKTTTLYTLLKLLHNPRHMIVTLEDPIEYVLPGIRQIQLNPQKHFSFFAGLKAIVRQDPDIIMVGEIRDKETAAIAINTSLTGHMLLSSMHTTDAATALVRLIDMNIDPYLVASAVECIIAQRLVRTLCVHCKQLHQHQLHYGIQSSYRPHPKGCEHCNYSGFADRTVVAEILTIGEEIRKLILEKAPSSRIRTYLQTISFSSLLDNGLKKVQASLVSLEELLSTVYEASYS